jgi:hypothetical protein
MAGRKIERSADASRAMVTARFFPLRNNKRAAQNQRATGGTKGKRGGQIQIEQQPDVGPVAGSR